MKARQLSNAPPPTALPPQRAGIESAEMGFALLTDLRCQGMARTIDTPVPGIAGFCAPVFGVA